MTAFYEAAYADEGSVQNRFESLNSPDKYVLD
jgi:hypothetical protein